MSRHGPVRRPVKRKMPTVNKVFLTLIVIVSLLLVSLIVYAIMSSDDGSGFDLGTFIQNPLGPSSSGPQATPDFIADLMTGVESVNPLTGMPMDEGKTRLRPLVIALGNTSDALPMNGVSKADIMYEVPVEGGLTRMLAIYQDFFGVEKVGSIRSARHYTAQITESYDGIFITAGSSPQALEEVRSRGIPHLNEVEGPHREIFYRDRGRISGRRLESLHSVVATSERAMEFLPEYDFRLLHESNYKNSLSFIDDGTPSGGASANEVVVNITSGKTTTFIYDSGSKSYYAHQYKKDFVDANNNSRASFANVLIIKTSVTPIPGDGAGRLNVDTVGGGDGYFVCGGKYIEINWSRADKASPFVYTLKNGSELEFGRGSTFICIIPTSQDAVFS